MRKRKSLFILILFLSFICFTKCKTINNNLLGVWIFESEINNLYINDTTVYKHQRPIIFDFQKNNDLVIKHFGIKNITIYSKWFLKSDSIINIDSLDYKIHKIKSKEISLIDYNRGDTFWIKLKKPESIKLKYNINQIEKILLSNIWSNRDSLNKNWLNHFEYFDNKSMILRYKRYQNDTLENLQLENWGITEYKNYLFLYNYEDMMFNRGLWEQINQILEINPNSYSITDFNNKIHKSNFYSIRKEKKNLNNIILGKWKSKNSNKKFYGEFLPEKQIEYGNVVLYDDELEFNIMEKTLEYKIGGIDPMIFNWEIGKDGKTLILEHEADNEIRNGTFIQFADIIEITDKKLKLRLFENSFFTGKEKPNRYLVNIIQEFKKIK